MNTTIAIIDTTTCKNLNDIITFLEKEKSPQPSSRFVPGYSSYYNSNNSIRKIFLTNEQFPFKVEIDINVMEYPTLTIEYKDIIMKMPNNILQDDNYILSYISGFLNTQNYLKSQSLTGYSSYGPCDEQTNICVFTERSGVTVDNLKHFINSTSGNINVYRSIDTLSIPCTTAREAYMKCKIDVNSSEYKEFVAAEQKLLSTIITQQTTEDNQSEINVTKSFDNQVSNLVNNLLTGSGIDSKDMELYMKTMSDLIKKKE